jgi:hypothetical protein
MTAHEYTKYMLEIDRSAAFVPAILFHAIFGMTTRGEVGVDGLYVNGYQTLAYRHFPSDQPNFLSQIKLGTGRARYSASLVGMSSRLTASGKRLHMSWLVLEPPTNVERYILDRSRNYSDRQASTSMAFYRESKAIALPFLQRQDAMPSVSLLERARSVYASMIDCRSRYLDINHFGLKLAPRLLPTGLGRRTLTLLRGLSSLVDAADGR